MYCKFCGKQIGYKKYPNGLCQSCYKYFLNGGRVYPIPQPGTIQRDNDGKIICHICGRSYTRLGSHVKESHNLTIEEYKKMFGLCANAKTTEKQYSDKMRSKAIEHEMDKQLILTGYNTRIKKGETHLRKGKEVRLQERLEKRARLKKG